MGRILGFVGFLLLLVSALSAATLTVDLNGGADYTDIHSAIDAAADGDTVLVKPGEYILSDTIRLGPKAITVRSENGAGETILRMAGHSAVVQFGTVVEGCAFDDFTVTKGSCGIHIYDPESDDRGKNVLEVTHQYRVAS